MPLQSRFFNRIFGGDFVEFRPSGFVNLDFAIQRQKVANPQFERRNQRTTNFLFDPHANINITGKVGEKMEVNGSFDTKASFQFENNFKIDYKSFEEDILQKVDFGNVSFPLNSSLIKGSENLFGITTELKFGRLNVKTVFANQRSSAEQIDLENGTQRRRFEVAAAEYEDNRHFFLSQFFRNNYENSLRTLPQVTSGVQITRIEVYITNRANNTADLRNVIGFLDLGDNQPFNPVLTTDPSFRAPDNEANNLNARVQNITDANVAASQLEGLGLNLENGRDFVIIRSARKLNGQEFTFNRELGYLSLLTPLRNDEALAVAYEYTFNGETFRVGELADDYANRDASEVVRLKMLRPNSVRIDLPTWDLMMKNVYSLNASQVS
ncbi:MAG: cell surface protein SprA, partial [Bacteroidota bacterium]